MSDAQLLLVFDESTTADASRERCEQVIAALGANPPALRLMSAKDLMNEADADPKRFQGVSVAWVVLDGSPTSSKVFECVAELQESRVPTLLSCAEGDQTLGEIYDEGVVHCPVDAPAEAIAPLLNALRSQSPVLRSLATDVRLMQAQQTGIAGQFDKIDEELRMALKIQQEFLPKQLPTCDALNFDVLWRPAGYVSGDIYNVERLDEDHYGIFIADAVGHGVPAALMTIYIKQAVHTRKLTPGIAPGYRLVPPGQAIAGLNKAMIEQDAGAASLGTAIYGVLDTRTNKLTIARAGHPAPLLLRANGETEMIEPDGAMLGIFPEEEFQNLTIQLEKGDRLLLYSDGFEVAFEDTGETKRLANEQYTREFEHMRKGSGDEALNWLRQKIDVAAGSLNQRDDLTVISTTVMQDAAEADSNLEPLGRLAVA